VSFARTRLARPALALALCALAAFALASHSGGASAAAPPAAPGCASQTKKFSGETGGFAGANDTTFRVAVNGVGASLYHLALSTDIEATKTGDLEVALVSPTGVAVTVAPDNAAEGANVFAGTLWEDSAPEPPAKAAFTSGVVASPLEPAQAFARLDGVELEGFWDLQIRSSEAAASGTLASWSLELSTCASTPTGTSFSPSSSTVVPVPEAGSASSTIAASGLPCFLESATVQTDLENASAPAVTMKLTSPQGETALLTSGNGKDNAAGVFEGTVWEDAAPTRVTSATLNGGKASPLEPEQGLSRLTGENPNGTWTLTVQNGSADKATLKGWTLNLQAAGSCPSPAPSTTAPSSTAPTAAPPASPPPPAPPRITRLALLPPRFRVQSRTHHKLTGGAKISFTISAAASVRLTVEALTTGVRSGSRCLTRTGHRHGGPCTLVRPLPGAIADAAHAGANSLPFTGRLDGRPLPAGRYRLTATIVGQGSAPPALADFTVLA
jgi:subtilisin-like proprotein convertase family protein